MKQTGPMPPGPRFEAFGASDRGRVRSGNEDAFAILAEQGLFVVADGIGGADAGEVASQVAVEVIPAKVTERLAKLPKNSSREKVESAVRQVLQEVNNAMVEQVGQRPDLNSMGTTVVLVLLWKGSILITHLGDSRAGLYLKGKLKWLTEDHTLAAQLARWGKITDSQVGENPGRSTLLKHLGMGEKLDPGFTWITPEGGCQLLLCTDGLTGMVSDHDIARIMESSSTPQSCCSSLIARANEAGGKDNITVIVVRFGPPA